jgi:hypothetical protein
MLSKILTLRFCLIMFLLSKILTFGSQVVCNHDLATSPGGASFSRGAIETVAQVPNAIVIATYVNIPFQIPPYASSEVCRFSSLSPTNGHQWGDGKSACIAH